MHILCELQLIKEWKSSGKNGAAWRREQNISYQTFCAWKKKARDKNQFSLLNQSPKLSFIQVTDRTAKETGLKIECKGINTYPSPDFNRAILKDFLQLVRDLPC